MAISEPIFETLAIGDELLTGKVTDTNSTFVAKKLFDNGWRLDRCTVIADDEQQILRQLNEVSTRASVVICFGGLGPTSDDKTADVVARWIGAELKQDASTLAKLESFLKKRKRPITEQNLKQTFYPAKADPLPNPKGLAVGFKVKKGECNFFFLPGVPLEMEAMWQESVLPQILTSWSKGEIVANEWRCVGIPESELQRKMNLIEQGLPAKAWLGYRTRFPENHLRLYWRQPDMKEFVEVKDRISEILKEFTYTQDEKELEDLIVDALSRKKLSVATAESCTGGLIAQRLTRVAGSSHALRGGWVVYQVVAKKIMLDVDLANEQDAVSAQCTQRLADAALKSSGADLGIAITGYMGPDGGTESDPDGTFYISIAQRGKATRTERFFQPAQKRDLAQWGASTRALDMLWKTLVNQIT